MNTNKSYPTRMMPSFAALAATVLLRSTRVLASMELPCPFETTLDFVNFVKPSDGTDCFLCVTTEPVDECSFACDGTVCAASPEGCGEIVCPEPWVPPPRGDTCPDVPPKTLDSCDFEGDCFYPETGDLYCGFSCLDGQVQMLCFSAGDAPPRAPPTPEGCPDVPPEMLDPCSFEGDCRYPESSNPNCGFSCFDGQVQMFCGGGGGLPPPPPTTPEGCPDVPPEMLDPCSFEGDCRYPESSNPNCGFSCFDGQVQMFCGGGGDMPPPPPTTLPVVPDCDAYTSCSECLAQEGCDAWSIGSCFPTCQDAPMDVSCWSTEYITDETPEEICQMAENEAADNELCDSQSDCESCLGAPTSEGGNNCQWFEDGYCGNGCGMMGCGVERCSADGGVGMANPNEVTVGMANPASVFCVENDGTLEIRKEEDGGEYGVCVFEDGSECEEFAYMREECAPGDSLSGDGLDEDASGGNALSSGSAGDPDQLEDETSSALDEDASGGNTSSGGSAGDSEQLEDETSSASDKGASGGNASSSDSADDPEPFENKTSSASGKDFFLLSVSCALVVGVAA